MRVRDLTLRAVPVLGADVLLSQGVTEMLAAGASCMLIRQADNSLRIVTEHDVVLFCQQSLLGQRQGDCMLGALSQPLRVAVHDETSLCESLAQALEAGVRHVPVLDASGDCCGVLSVRDMMETYAGVVREKCRLEAQNDALRELSLEDPLMKIGNRRAMEADLAFSQEMFLRYQTPYAAALLDLDFFKRYNDDYGHQAGDDALQLTARLLQGAKRETDQLYRYGGEEILVLMRGTLLPEAQKAAGRFCLAVHAAKLEHRHSPHHWLTVSIGVAAGPCHNWYQLVAAADRALYQAKAAGRNVVRCATMDGLPALLLP